MENPFSRGQEGAGEGEEAEVEVEEEVAAEGEVGEKTRA